MVLIFCTFSLFVVCCWLLYRCRLLRVFFWSFVVWGGVGWGGLICCCNCCVSIWVCCCCCRSCCCCCWVMGGCGGGWISCNGCWIMGCWENCCWGICWGSCWGSCWLGIVGLVIWGWKVCCDNMVSRCFCCFGVSCNWGSWGNWMVCCDWFCCCWGFCCWSCSCCCCWWRRIMFWICCRYVVRVIVELLLVGDWMFVEVWVSCWLDWVIINIEKRNFDFVNKFMLLIKFLKYKKMKSII